MSFQQKTQQKTTIQQMALQQIELKCDFTANTAKNASLLHTIFSCSAKCVQAPRSLVRDPTVAHPDLLQWEPANCGQVHGCFNVCPKKAKQLF